MSLIQVAPENDLLYDRFGIANRDDADLAISIRDKGIQEPLREAIESVIDVAEFNAQVEQEAQDSAHIQAHRKVVFEAINGRAAN